MPAAAEVEGARPVDRVDRRPLVAGSLLTVRSDHADARAIIADRRVVEEAAEAELDRDVGRRRQVDTDRVARQECRIEARGEIRLPRADRVGSAIVEAERRVVLPCLDRYGE